MKGHSKNKLALIYFISNPKVKITHWNLEKETEIIPSNNHNEYPEKKSNRKWTSNLSILSKPR